jgi:hypothetical protein
VPPPPRQSPQAALISDSSVAVTYPSLSTSSSATFINSQFWTPSGDQTLAIRAQLWMQGAIAGTMAARRGAPCAA